MNDMALRLTTILVLVMATSCIGAPDGSDPTEEASAGLSCSPSFGEGWGTGATRAEACDDAKFGYPSGVNWAYCYPVSGSACCTYSDCSCARTYGTRWEPPQVECTVLGYLYDF